MLKKIKMSTIETFNDIAGFIRFVGRYVLFGAIIYALWYYGGILLVIIGLILWRAYKRSSRKDTDD